MISKPMKAPNQSCDPHKLSYPVVASPKLDGIRCLVVDGTARTSSLLLQPNAHIQKLVSLLPEGLDGELMLRADVGFSQIQSSVMSRGGEPDFIFRVFDLCRQLEEPFFRRYARLREWCTDNPTPPPAWVKLVPHWLVRNVETLLKLERVCLRKGYEGVMIRAPRGPYKCGRSTMKQGWLLKLKRFKDAEAIVVDVEEKYHNFNEPYTDELGHTKRSSSKAGKVPAGTLGKLVVQAEDGTIFRIGVFKDLDAADKQALWNKRDELPGRLAKFRYQVHGTKDRPRIPVFLGWRDPRDT